MNLEDPWPEVATELGLPLQDLQGMIAEVDGQSSDLDLGRMSLCRDRLDRPISYGQWTMLFASREYRLVAYTNLRDGTHVSTIWLGFDHGYGVEGGLFYETMVFPGSGDVDLCHRFRTEAEAVADHDQVVAGLNDRLRSS
jgi:hypothetical protein